MVEFIKVDIDNPNMRDICRSYTIRSVPTLVYINDMEEVDQIVGIPNGNIKNIIIEKAKQHFVLCEHIHVK